MQSPEYVGETVVTLATAHIGKFTENILESPGAKDFDESIRSAIQKSIPEGLSKLSGAKTRRIDINNSVDDIKAYLTQHVSK
jgi:threonine synthase